MSRGQEESEPGYWSPCQEKACRIEYGTHPAVIPLSVRITGYVKNEGQIMVGIPVGSGENTSFIIIDTKSSNEGAWVDYVVDLRRHQEYKYGIILMHNGGTAVLDWVTFMFQDETTTGEPTTELPTTVPQTQPPTTTAGAGRIMSSFFSTLIMFVLRKVY
ncbi:uncharacterized protein LOC118438867 [Folsomia candida]|uniref:uncharacterized protein LOC118438867 n=1 Tax=Folsomia candida TaxID=158441 RepID=UPI0016053FD1|nr:uncharacterized protein LOC118438867 [Folsomia candida]